MWSSTDVFPPRNLGAGENWGRTVESRQAGSQSEIETLKRQVEGLTQQVNSLSGIALPASSRIPTNVHYGNAVRNLPLTVATTWVPFVTGTLAIPTGAVQALVTVFGTLQLKGVSASVDAPWVRVSHAVDDVPTGWVPDGQGVRASVNPGGIYLATVGSSFTLSVSGGLVLSLSLDGWSSSATNYATPDASNLASLFAQVQFYSSPVVSEIE